MSNSGLDSADLAGARLLLLSYFSKHPDEDIAQFALSRLESLRRSSLIKDCEDIYLCGQELFHQSIQDDPRLLGVRTRFEENEELTWDTFENNMDECVGEIIDWESVGFLLNVVSNIRVPKEEFDDLLDLAAWYTNTRITPFVRSNGGWRAFNPIETPCAQEIELGSMIILQNKNDEKTTLVQSTISEDNSESTLTDLTRSSCEKSDLEQFSNSPIETEEIIVREDISKGNSPNIENLSKNIGEAPLVADQIQDSTETLSDSNTASPSPSNNVDLDYTDNQVGQREDRGDAAIDFSQKMDPKFITSEESSSERLSSSPVLITPPSCSSATPVYIESQPESLGGDALLSETESIDGELINELIINLKEIQKNNISGNEGESSDPESSDEYDESDGNIANIGRSDTVKNLKGSPTPLSDSIDIDKISEKNEDVEEKTSDGIVIRKNEEICDERENKDFGKLHSGHKPEVTIKTTPIVQQETHQRITKTTNENIAKQKLITPQQFNEKVESVENSQSSKSPSSPYLLLAGAAAIGIAVYVKMSR